VKAGPKTAVEPSQLSLKSNTMGAPRFARFCKQYIIVPKGKDALKPLRLRRWQVELVGSVLAPDPPASLAGWMLPRGQGKSALVAALGLYDLMLGAEGASVVVVATDERQAGIVFGATVRTDNRGTRIYKEHKHSTRRIDLAVCAIMAHSAAASIDPGLQLYWYDEAS
jgi:phage terminase large subunit-like protein